MLSDIRYRHFVDLVTMRIDDRDEPAAPIPSRHDRPVFEVACQRQRIFASGCIACQINTFVIVQNLFAVTEVEVITRHGETIRSEKYHSSRGGEIGVRVVGPLWGPYARSTLAA